MDDDAMQSRIESLNDAPYSGGAVCYWTSREQRVRDNYPLLFAQNLAFEAKSPLVVAFCLQSEFLGATEKIFNFMSQGLRQAGDALRRLNIPLCAVEGEPKTALVKFIDKNNIKALVCDFDPLKIKRKWVEDLRERLNIPFWRVDGHNVVPCRVASDKREYAAYTIRPKINRLLSEYLVEIPDLKRHKYNDAEILKLANYSEKIGVTEKIAAYELFPPGEEAAMNRLRFFIERKLAGYDERRNDPNADAQSDLSPYFHFGKLAPQKAALEVSRTDAPDAAKAAFLEELVVRRELSDNFCYYDENYDNTACFPDWAKNSFAERADDPREYVYPLEAFEGAETRDELWNAAQREMTSTGKMSGYMRMYWAKKILEWTRSPEEAMNYAIYLNDKYSLDGRDPNGYAGIAWSVGGVHDRAWRERPVFGKVRYMSQSGAKRKFDVKAYIKRYSK